MTQPDSASAPVPPFLRDPAPMLARIRGQWAGHQAGGGRHADLWIFGYASLIWRPDFESTERHATRVHGAAPRVTAALVVERALATREVAARLERALAALGREPAVQLVEVRATHATLVLGLTSAAADAHSACLFAALAVYLFIISVARAHNPWGALAPLLS